MPRILEMREIDGKLAVFLDLPPREASPVTLWTEDEKNAALQAARADERSECADEAEKWRTGPIAAEYIRARK